ncbi:transcriptional regulator [Streptomyces sp. WAC 06738]|nr:transcriptional regulator [Streptomyces sp. WAC 06738]
MGIVARQHLDGTGSGTDEPGTPRAREPEAPYAGDTSTAAHAAYVDAAFAPGAQGTPGAPGALGDGPGGPDGRDPLAGPATGPAADPATGPGGPDDPEDPAGAPSHAAPRRRMRRGRKVLLGAVIMLFAGVLMVAGGLWWAYEHYTGRVDRIPNAFPTNVPEKHRPAPSKGGETYLLVGVDARSDLPLTGDGAGEHTWKPGAQRSDTMMLVHLPEGRDGGYVVSLPRDSWVNIPGRGDAKLNAAFSYGGPPLLIDTVQRMTKVKIDHLAVIDWSGFKRLTDAVGGVDITIDETTPRRNGGGEWTAGTHHMDGKTALDYVRERHGLPRGDLDRTQRQQNFLRAVITETMSSDNFSNPLKVKRLLDAVTATVSVDDRFSDGAMRDLMWDMKGVRSGDLVFMNAPVAGLDMIEGQSVVLLDDKAGDPLWEAMRNDTMAQYVEKYPTDRLGGTAP